MRVTLDIFSGRPNPSWSLSPEESRQLVDRFAGRAVTPPSQADFRPGFRGFIFSAESDDQAAYGGLAPSFRLESGGAQPSIPRPMLAGTRLMESEVQDATTWLLNTARGEVDEKVGEYVNRTLKAPAAPIGRPAAAVRAGTWPQIPAGCTVYHLPYYPAFWNQPTIQPSNNCYNYAANFVSNTMAQPGRITGRVYGAFTRDEISDAAARDGCSDACHGLSTVVALAVWPGFDFHWYRRHLNGFWGHKVGFNVVSFLDADTRVIAGDLNPSNCNRGPYTEFCGYRFVLAGVRVL